MKAKLGFLIVISTLCGLVEESRAIDFGHTTKPRPAKQQPAVSPDVAATPEATTQVMHTPCANGDCNSGFGVTKSSSVSVPHTTIEETVQKVDCVKLTYKMEEYEDWEPAERTVQEKYTYDINVTVPKTGKKSYTGYKEVTGSKTVTTCETVPVVSTVKKPIYDNCGCLKGYQDVSVTRWVNQYGSKQVPVTYQEPYTYEQAYNYSVNEVQQKVGVRDVQKVEMVPVVKTRQVPSVEPDAYYVKTLVHTATYTVRSEFQARVPKAEGEALEARQNARQQAQP